MKSIAVASLACACAIGCGGNFSGGGGPSGAGGSPSGGGSSAGESAGGALQAGADAGGAAQSGAGGAARAGADSGGQAGAGAASGSGGECNAIDLPAPAQPLKFVLQTNTPVFVKETCTLNYQLTSICSGSTPLSTEAFCVADCNDASMGCIACGACFSGVREVTPSAPQEIDWDGKLYDFGTAPNGCSCATSHGAPSGAYTFSIDAYLSADDAMTGANAFHHRVDFRLPAPNDTVIVDLGFMGI
ncbi:MAG: hypothetical protein ABW061_19230 [Polyangiaceae bacterium]